MRFPTPEIFRKDRSLTASDAKTRSLKPDGACQIDYRIIHSNPRAVGIFAPSITMGERTSPEPSVIGEALPVSRSAGSS